MINHLSRRELLKGFLVSAGYLLLNGQAFAGEKEPNIIEYKTILGNNPEEDRWASLDTQIEFYGQFADFLSGVRNLEVPEDALIRYTKKKAVRIPIKTNKSRVKHIRIVSERQQIDHTRHVIQVYQTVEFDLRKYLVRKDQLLKDLVEELSGGYKTTEDKAQALLCFVQTGIKYDHKKIEARSRDPNLDFVRRPQQTLCEGKGDCKDTSVLYSTLLDYIGVRSAFLYYPNHVNVGINLNFRSNSVTGTPSGMDFDGIVKHKGRTYYVAETTPEQPMFIGKLMKSQIGQKLERVVLI